MHKVAAEVLVKDIGMLKETEFKSIETNTHQLLFLMILEMREMSRNLENLGVCVR